MHRLIYYTFLFLSLNIPHRFNKICSDFLNCTGIKISIENAREELKTIENIDTKKYSAFDSLGVLINVFDFSNLEDKYSEEYFIKSSSSLMYSAQEFKEDKVKYHLQSNSTLFLTTEMKINNDILYSFGGVVLCKKRVFIFSYIDKSKERFIMVKRNYNLE